MVRTKVHRSRDGKRGRISKIWPVKFETLPPNLRIRGHLLAPIRNGGEDRVWKWSKMGEFPTFVGSWPWRWIRAWSLPFLSSLIVIKYYLYTKFHRNRRNFLWTDGHTDGYTDGQTDRNLLPMVLGRLPKFGSRPKMETRHPVEGKYGGKFTAIFNHCEVMAVWSRKTWKLCVQFWYFFGKTSYGKITLLHGWRPKSAKASPQQCAHSALGFIQIGSL